MRSLILDPHLLFTDMVLGHSAFSSFRIRSSWHSSSSIRETASPNFGQTESSLYALYVDGERKQIF